MKKVLYIFTSVITCVALCTAMISCDIETSDNGNLDGFWQLTQIDSVANNKSVSMKESQIFWAFQTDVMEVRNLKAGDTKVLFRFEKTGNQLSIHTPYLEKDKDHRELLSDSTILKTYCIQGLGETYEINQLSNSNMQLSGSVLRLHFRKY